MEEKAKAEGGRKEEPNLGVRKKGGKRKGEKV